MPERESLLFAQSLQNSDREQTVSDSLFYKSKSLFRSQIPSNLLEKPKSEVPTLQKCFGK